MSTPDFENINLSLPMLFTQYMVPYGFLTEQRETHACMYYYLLARKNWEEQQNGIVYEGDKDPEFNYVQLCKSVARVYGVRPEGLALAWDLVDKTCVMWDLPILPNEERYRPYSRAIIV